MRVLRFAIGFVFLTSSAASVACAQHATTCAKQKAEHARREHEVARAHFEHSLQETEAARARVERDLEATAEARACAERGLQEAEVSCAASTDAKAKKIRHYHLQDSEKLAAEALRACEVAEHVQEALARQVDAEEMHSTEMQHHLEALAAMTELQDSAELHVLELNGNGQLGSLMAGLGREDGSSQRLKERIRALEERLGMAGEHEERSLEERVAELERRTMAGEERKARSWSEPARPRGLFNLRPAPVPALPGEHAPEAGHPAHAHRGVYIPHAPEAAEAPEAPEAAEAPEAPEAPEPAGMLRRWQAEGAGPSAPRPPRASGAHSLTPERRREIEEVMQRMRGEMDRLREEMSLLREQMGNNEPMRSLRRLGSSGGSGGSGAR
ncbi:MAG: hypothetical protein ACKVXR_06390 [Planctomycetota bacterium]